MLFEWTPEIVAEMLSTLTESEQSAITFEQSVGNRSIGLKRLATFGFSSIDEYYAALDSAKLKAREYLATKYNITSLHDLGFDEPQVATGHDLERNLQYKPRTKKPKGFGESELAIIRPGVPEPTVVTVPPKSAKKRGPYKGRTEYAPATKYAKGLPLSESELAIIRENYRIRDRKRRNKPTVSECPEPHVATPILKLKHGRRRKPTSELTPLSKVRMGLPLSDSERVIVREHNNRAHRKRNAKLALAKAEQSGLTCSEQSGLNVEAYIVLLNSSSYRVPSSDVFGTFSFFLHQNSSYIFPAWSHSTALPNLCLHGRSN